MKVSFEGIQEQAVTFEAITTGSQAVETGAPASLSADGTVRKAEAGDVPVGLVLEVRGGYAGVQTHGYQRMPCAADLTVGFARLAVAEGGKLAVSQTGREGFVVDVDASAGVCGVIF